MPTDIKTHIQQATDDLNLSPQEQNLYKMHLDNLWSDKGVDNPDGSRSTLYQSVQEHEGSYYSIPTVWDGKRETEPYTRDDGKTFDVPNATALSNVDKMGWDTFPSGKDPDALDARYSQMHDYMEQDTSDYMNMAGSWN